MAWQVKHPLRNDSAVSDDENGVRRDGLEFGAQLGVVLDLVRLEDRDPVLECCLLNWRGLELLVATEGTIGLRDGERDLVTGGDDSLQRGHSELWGSAEDESHAFYAIRLQQLLTWITHHSPFLISFLILRMTRSFLRRLRRSMKRMPSRWSISCWKARDRSSSPSISNHSPSVFCARTFTFAARLTFSRISGSERQPSSSYCWPSRWMISGLMRTTFASGSFLKEMSMTVRRCERPICGAARPMPCASYMDSNISSTRVFSLSSNTVTGSPRLASTGSGYFTIS